MKIYPESKNEIGLWVAPCFAISANDLYSLENIVNNAVFGDKCIAKHSLSCTPPFFHFFKSIVLSALFLDSLPNYPQNNILIIYHERVK